MENKVENKIRINADTATVWKTLTKPELVKEYLYDCRVETTWNKGSEIWYTQEKNGEKIVRVNGRIIEIIPQKLLKLSIIGTQEGYHQYVTMTYELETADKNKTDLLVREEGFEYIDQGRKRYEQSKKGWEMVLPKLKAVAEQQVAVHS